MDSLCDFLSNTKLPEEKIKEQIGFSGIHSCLGWDERHMFNLCDPGHLLLDVNLPSLTQILRDGNDTHKQGGMIFSNSYAMPYALCTMLFLRW